MRFRSIKLTNRLRTAMGAAAVGLFASSVMAATPVDLATGKVEGVTAAGVESFKGIPYAAPPVGELRWRAPQPAPSWSGVRVADTFGQDCMQTPFGGDAAPLGTTPAEDCLVINVWRPAGISSSAKLPVIFWIYGGGFVNGGSSPPVYDGSAFARKGVIMVSFNYRLGRFGFFGFPALSAENKDGGLLGNYGYMDQVAALKWVQANIASFGGDPSNVTIFGESAGGGSVHTLMTSAESRGLFAKAIVQSGGGRGNLMGNRELRTDKPNLPSSETLGVNFARRKGIQGTDAAALASLRALTAEELNDGLGMMTMGQAAETYGGPMIDGRIVAEPPQTVYESGRQAKVPLMIGGVTADIGFGFAPTKEAAFAAFGTLADQAKAAYDPDGTKPLPQINAEIAMDKMMIEPSRFVAATLARQGVPAYHFRFGYVADSMVSEWKTGAPHATEIPYVMDTVKEKYGDKLTARDAKIADQTNSYWANFAKTGKPDGPGLAAWPQYDPEADILMLFTSQGVPVAQRDPWKARMDVIAAAADLPPPPPAPTRTADGHYASNLTPLGDMLDDPAAKAVLDTHISDIVNSPNIGMGRSMTLLALQADVPTLTKELLARIDADLAKLPPRK
ncbi:para-nitrobenzyl esterase [Asticcacaulis biprosthecium C19]|uniref:Carboxylic ester hydrolase n=1 Tax=Asticcacaulis biprosthecium C19 TaxID=715226 RepID=F4QMJ8_9CAUL|nr:carboxylesterase family protein [Asticcacaulis biprosthecium]EGF91439.1 para-nitrobenzyl esterase [Asticcacaulis biprosthecium C19]